MSWTVMGSTGAVTTGERAIRALYDEHATALHGYVLRLLGGDRHRAEDVVQETLLRCWRSVDLEDEQSPRPWLFRVARNLVIDDFRLRMARPREVSGAPWLDEVLGSSDDIDRLLTLMTLRKAFAALSPKHREVLYESYYLGRSTSEAAVVLGVPPGTVKSRIHHALRALRTVHAGIEAAAADDRAAPLPHYGSAA